MKTRRQAGATTPSPPPRPEDDRVDDTLTPRGKLLIRVLVGLYVAGALGVILTAAYYAVGGPPGRRH